VAERDPTNLRATSHQAEDGDREMRVQIDGEDVMDPACVTRRQQVVQTGLKLPHCDVVGGGDRPGVGVRRRQQFRQANNTVSLAACTDQQSDAIPRLCQDTPLILDDALDAAYAGLGGEVQ
jgi:hypothetical protein